MAPRQARRATASELARYKKNIEKANLKEIATKARKATARGIQEFAVRSMNSLVDVGPLWTGSFASSWGFAPFDKEPNKFTHGTTGRKPKYTKNNARITDIERLLKDGYTKFRIVNTSDHAEIAVDEKPSVFIRPHFAPKPLAEANWEHGDKYPRSGLRYDIGRPVDPFSIDAYSSRTAEPDWFPIYVLGGALQKDLSSGFSFGFREAGV